MAGTRRLLLLTAAVPGQCVSRPAGRTRPSWRCRGTRTAAVRALLTDCPAAARRMSWWPSPAARPGTTGFGKLRKQVGANLKRATLGW